MDLSGALLNEVMLEVYDEEWVQTVDYESTLVFRSSALPPPPVVFVVKCQSYNTKLQGIFRILQRYEH